eukprot:CAMPEP_0116983234 /NCGR_PEP_ID=MMETSP0467-20121206/60841_1 /TAXON_ID=283647 /ORGANISM="Mesodinium pulex, Strain SPMC105" /LENGTH=65 /DNA_ID=CAMNT_0004677927 /DNA_START=693 /DNA_END=890 /DNA_ORIENTATION=-
MHPGTDRTHHPGEVQTQTLQHLDPPPRLRGQEVQEADGGVAEGKRVQTALDVRAQAVPHGVAPPQ